MCFCHEFLSHGNRVDIIRHQLLISCVVMSRLPVATWLTWRPTWRRESSKSCQVKTSVRLATLSCRLDYVLTVQVLLYAFNASVPLINYVSQKDIFTIMCTLLVLQLPALVTPAVAAARVCTARCICTARCSWQLKWVWWVSRLFTRSIFLHADSGTEQVYIRTFVVTRKLDLPSVEGLSERHKSWWLPTAFIL